MKEISFVLGLAGLLLISGCVSNTVQSTATNIIGNEISHNNQSNELRKLELSVEMLWCESCVYGIKSVMAQTKGIESAEVEITDSIAQTGTARIIYDPKKITKEDIAKLTKPYPSKIVKDSPIN